MKRVMTNAAAAECVRHKTPFVSKSGILSGKQITHTDADLSKGITACTVERYVVRSKGAPIYVFDFPTQKWFGNNTARHMVERRNIRGGRTMEIENTLAKHVRLLMPRHKDDITWLDHVEMDVVHNVGVAQLVAYKMVNA